MVRLACLFAILAVASPALGFDPFGQIAATPSPTAPAPIALPADSKVIFNDDIGDADDDCNNNGQSPCFHGGLCFNDTVTALANGGIECACPPGFAGTRCETRVESIQWRTLGNCEYAHVKTKASWMDSMLQCHVVGSELASVHSYTEDRFISQLATDGRNNVARWIGLFNPTADDFSVWAWSDYQKVSYTNWMNGNPMASTGGKCIAQDNDNQLPGWFNDDCDEERRFVCKRCYGYAWNKEAFDTDVAQRVIPTAAPVYKTAAPVYVQPQSSNNRRRRRRRRKKRCNRKCKRARKQAALQG